ncbi:MAG: hypothetical protein V7776_23505 [Halopseudomonas aestusnigri]
MTFSKLKAHLRRIGAPEPSKARYKRSETSVNSYEPQEYRNFFKAAGYVSD